MPRNKAGAGPDSPAMLGRPNHCLHEPQEKGFDLLHTLTFLELYTLQIERIPQHVAAPWLILLSEKQQV